MHKDEELKAIDGVDNYRYQRGLCPHDRVDTWSAIYASGLPSKVDELRNEVDALRDELRTVRTDLVATRAERDGRAAAGHRDFEAREKVARLERAKNAERDFYGMVALRDAARRDAGKAVQQRDAARVARRAADLRTQQVRLQLDAAVDRSDDLMNQLRRANSQASAAEAENIRLSGAKRPAPDAVWYDAAASYPSLKKLNATQADYDELQAERDALHCRAESLLAGVRAAADCLDPHLEA